LITIKAIKMKKMLPLQSAISLSLVLVLALFLISSNTTIEQGHDEAIKQLSSELALVKAQMASLKVVDREADLAAEPLLAEIILFGGNFAPRGWAFCEGQTLPISQNTALFSLLGTTYGGDGRTSFRLPDLRPSEEQLNSRGGGPRYIIAVQGIFPSRN
jgi:hypothetical protein